MGQDFENYKLPYEILRFSIYYCDWRTRDDKSNRNTIRLAITHKMNTLQGLFNSQKLLSDDCQVMF